MIKLKFNALFLALFFVLSGALFLIGCDENNTHLEFVPGDLDSASIIINGQPITRRSIEQVKNRYETLMQTPEASLTFKERAYLEATENIERIIEEWGFQFSEYELNERISREMDNILQRHQELGIEVDTVQIQISLNEEIAMLIRGKVILQEAQRRRLHVPQENIDHYVESTMYIFQ